MKYLSLLIPVALLASCASVGHKLDEDAVNHIHKGLDKTQVIQLVGSPDSTTRSSSGDTTFTYIYSHSQIKGTTFIPIAGAFMGGADLQHQTLTVIFDQNGIVKEYSSSSGGMDVNSGLQAGPRPNQPGLDDSKRPK